MVPWFCLCVRFSGERLQCGRRCGRYSAEIIVGCLFDVGLDFTLVEKLIILLKRCGRLIQIAW